MWILRLIHFVDLSVFINATNFPQKGSTKFRAEKEETHNAFFAF